MPKLSQIAKGARARKPVTFTLLDGTEVTAAMRPLDGDDHAEVLAAATEAVKGIEAQKPEALPAFKFAEAIETVARAFVDPDSDAAKPEPFFDGGPEDVRKHLDRDRIFWLYEQHTQFQAALSPMKAALGADDFYAAIVALAESEEGQDPLPFETWQPALRGSFMRTTARLLLSYLTDRSSTGSGDEAEPRSS